MVQLADRQTRSALASTVKTADPQTHLVLNFTTHLRLRLLHLVMALAAGWLAPSALAATASPLQQCSWNQPGIAPFGGDVVAAVDRYTDIPAPVRARLKARMASRTYDEVVSIRRDAIVGRAQYGAAIKDMHFAGGRVCASVDRKSWAADAQERGLVYCESGECILVPTVCRNVSRITRHGPAVAGASAETGDGGAGQPGAKAAAGKPLGAISALPSSAADKLATESAGGSTPALLTDSSVTSPAAADDSFVAALADHQVAAATPETTVGWQLAPTMVPRPGSGSGLIDLDGLHRAPAPEGGGVSALPAVPEPGSWALLLIGLAALAGLAKRHRRVISPA